MGMQRGTQKAVPSSTKKIYKSCYKVAFEVQEMPNPTHICHFSKDSYTFAQSNTTTLPFHEVTTKGVPQQSEFIFPTHRASTDTYIMPTNSHSKSKKRKRGGSGEQYGETTNLHMLLLRVVVTTNGDRTERMEDVRFRRNP